MTFKNNKKKELFIIKIKDNKGSAMSLVIVAMSLLLVFAPYMTRQISNQFKSTRVSYNGIQEKYLAEAGIERSISEIEKQVKSNVTRYNLVEYSNTNHHSNDNCPKVEFQNNDLPQWGFGWDEEGSYNKLIHMDLISNKIADKYKILLNSYWDDDFHPKIDLYSYYENSIRKVSNNITVMDKKNIQECKEQYNQFKENINKFISMINEAMILVTNSHANNKEVIIDSYKEMIGYMEEIKCRLGMGSTSGGEEIIENKPIEVPYYEVTIDDSDNIIFSKNNARTINCQITIKKQNGQITSIDFTNINNNLIGAKSYDYEINADIDFTYIKKSNSIEQSVNSYNRVN